MLNNKRIAAAILAGGKATRLGGIAKGNIVINNNVTIVQHLLDGIRKAEIATTIIVANDFTAYERYGVKIIADLLHDVGPLAGIASALKYFSEHEPRYENILILPCDLPNLTTVEISQLIDAFYLQNRPIVFATTASITNPSIPQTEHPLCAVLNRSVLPALQQIIAEKQHKVRLAWQSIGAIPVLFTNATNFHNINTPNDIENKK